MVNLKLKSQYIFGKDAVEYLNSFLTINKFEKVMLLYGKGSIKENGLYKQLQNVFEHTKTKVIEFNGIKPNPSASQVYQAAELARREGVKLIIAAGGGSVIDASKVIGTLTANENFTSTREYFKKQDLATKKSIPIVSIITMAGTASENNSGSVITFEDSDEKVGIFDPTATPIVCISDSSYLKSVSNWQLASGMFDCMSHLLEQYLGPKTFGWSKEYLFANIRNLYKYSLRALNNREDKEALDNVLWTTTMSLNDLSKFNCIGDWNVHTLEHALSAKWDVTHGAGLALITPVYIELLSKVNLEFKQKILVLAKEVFGTNGVDGLLEVLNQWIKNLKLPSKWTDFKEIKQAPNKQTKEWLVNHALEHNHGGFKLSKEFFLEVLDKIA